MVALADAVVWFDAARPGTDPSKWQNLGSGGSAYDALIGGVVLNAATMAYVDKSIGALRMPGVSGNYAFSYNRPQLQVTGDLEFILRIAVPDWTPTASQILISKRGAAGNVGWNLNLVLTTGVLQFAWSANGTTVLTANSTVAPVAVDGSPIWIKVTFDVDNGAAGNDVTFFTSTDGVIWLPLGDKVTTAGTTSIFASTATLDIAAQAAANVYYNATTYRAIVKNGIDGTVVADFNPNLDAVWPYQYWVSSVSGEGWTVASPSIYTTARPKYLRGIGRRYLWLPGITGNAATTPDSTALDITGDLEIQWFGVLESSGLNGSLVTKYAGAGQRSYAFVVLSTNTLTLTWSVDGTASVSVSSTVAWTTVASIGQDVGFKVTFDVDNGAVGNDVKFWYTLDPASTVAPTWTQLGATVTTAGVAAIFNSTATGIVGFNANYTASAGDLGRHYRAIIKSGIGGTTVFDADFSKLTDGADVSLTEDSVNAAIVTITRSATNRKSVVVSEDVIHFGLDDYWEIPDGSLVDFAATDSFSALAQVRQWAFASSMVLIGKRAGVLGSAGTVGWQLYTSSGSALGLAIDDGAVRVADAQTGLATGVSTVFTGVRNVATDDVTVYNGATATAATSDTTTATLANADAVRVGRTSGAATTYTDMELKVVALYRVALTLAQITDLTNALNTRGAQAATAQDLYTRYPSGRTLTTVA